MISWKNLDNLAFQEEERRGGRRKKGEET